MTSSPVVLGKVIGSKEHSTYLAAVYREGEIDKAPSSEDYALGSFVKIDCLRQNIVGIITSTMIVPFESSGLHHSPAKDMKIFSPELLDGSVTVVEVKGIGILKDGVVDKSGIPSISPSHHDRVYRMEKEDIINFHQTGEEKELNLGYVPELKDENSDSRIAVSRALENLCSLIPEKKEIVEMILREREWKLRFG